MARAQTPSKPYKQFALTTRRCLALAQIYNETIAEGMKPNHDLLRSVVVLSVASMDAYFTDKFCDLVVPVLKRGRAGDSMIELLTGAGLDTRQSLQLLAMDRPYRRIRTLITHHLELRTTQRLDAIDALFLCFGLKNFSENVQARLGKTGLLRRVERWVERRHKIVHRGDYNKHGRLNPIDPGYTIARLHELFFFVKEAEAFLREVVS